MSHTFRLFILLFLVGSATAQSSLLSESSSRTMSRSELRSEILRGPTSWQENRGMAVTGTRSVPLAFGLSAVVPGAGQVYNGFFIKGGVAIALEAALITGYSVLRSNGLDAETEFQKWAHRSWSPVKYASWINDYADYLRDELGVSISAPPVDLISGIDFTQPDSWSASERAQVDGLISQIHAIEVQAIHPETGARFSHQLPSFADQQYYELIGKYFQFAPGWEDYPEWRDGEGRFTQAIDPELSGPGDTKPNVSTSFYDYASDHGDAQDTLRQASRISMLFFFNHLIAAVDAAVSAKLHNDRLDTRLGLSYDPDGSPVLVTGLVLSF